MSETNLLPPKFEAWFQSRGWAPRAHQLALLEHGLAGRSALLIAPTGAGKTLAGFLPSLVDLAARPKWKPGTRRRGIHTLYISPLKALAVDIERNLEAPVAGMALDIGIETRTGDTSASRRQRQKLIPPDILLTTPEQLALLIAAPDADTFFEDLKTVILDELHALVTSKRGDLLALGLARLRAIAPGVRMVGLSATVAEPDELRAWLMPQRLGATPVLSELVTVPGGAKPDISIFEADENIPWAGHSARYAYDGLLTEIGRHKMSLIFVNTRSQAELVFAELWRLNETNLPIALHHGSLDVGQRRKVEAAMAEGRLRAVVATSTLDLGIDWGDVDLVIHIGAPKGASRLAQRVGRANHRMDEPSKALLVPANRFEVLECQAALDANYVGAQDTPPLRDGALDVLAQHVLGRAVAGPFFADAFFAEVTSAYAYRGLDRAHFDRVVDLVATGGYALRTYERYAKIKLTADGTFRLTHPKFAQAYRLNVGTIIESPMLKVRLGGKARGSGPVMGGRLLGEIEEYFCEQMKIGDTFLFAGEVLRLEGIRENEAVVSRARASSPRIPVYSGGKFPLSTFLAAEVRRMLADPTTWSRLPAPVRDWLELQREHSALPRADELLVETFPHEGRFFLVLYPFEGRLAHQTLGMLLTRRLERFGLKPLGFVATDYVICVSTSVDLGRAFALDSGLIGRLLEPDMLGDDLETWMAESFLLKRMFKACAQIAGLVEKNAIGAAKKTGRQVTVSTDLIYDVLRLHEPDHILLEAAWADASTGLLDLKRLSDMLSRITGRILNKRLEKISPLAVPIMLEIGGERVSGDADEDILRAAADDIIREAMA